MTPAVLIVQNLSYGYIRNTVRFIHAALKTNFGPGCALVLCDEIDEAACPEGALVLVIGENFAPHSRKPGCRYVYLNFSIVEILGNPLRTSRQGHKAARRKRALLDAKLDRYDAVLDFFPPQTDRLAGTLDLPVRGFPISVLSEDIRPAPAPRPYDVCFVGGPSDRRSRILDQIDARGLTRSPRQGVVFEDVAAQSRICLNIHAQRSCHLETPRLVGAAAAGCAVLTESSFGLNTLMPEDLVSIARPGRMARRLCDLLNDPENLQRQAGKLQSWFRDTHHPAAMTGWADLCHWFEEIEEPALTK